MQNDTTKEQPVSETKFVFRKVYPFTWTVKVPEGVVPAFEFKARFESVSQSEIDAMTKPGVGLQDADLLARVFKGWLDGELLDVVGAPMPATPENMAAVIDQPFLRVAIVKAYFEAVSGLTAKN